VIKSVTVFIERYAAPAAVWDAPSYNSLSFICADTFHTVANCYLVDINSFSASAERIENFPVLCCLLFYCFFVSHEKNEYKSIYMGKEDGANKHINHFSR
jgi:hypothetical protein